MTKTIRIGLTTAVVLALTAGCASQDSGPAPEAAAAPEVTTALNAGADDTATEATAPAEEKTTKLICRKIKPTGSRFGERVCMRPEQWEKYAGQSRKELDRVTRDGLQDNGSGGG